jgi:hypothetical protein
MPDAPKLVGPVDKPPDPAAEFLPKFPVTLVGPVGEPPEPAALLKPKFRALTEVVPASTEAARQADDKIVRTKRFRFMVHSY